MTTSVRLVRDGEKMTAVVVAQERTSSHNRPGETPRTLFRPTLEFVDPATGERVQKRTATSSNTYNYSIGSDVEIYVARDGSAEFKVYSFVHLWLVPSLFLVGGVVGFLLAGALWHVDRGLKEGTLSLASVRMKAGGFESPGGADAEE